MTVMLNPSVSFLRQVPALAQASVSSRKRPRAGAGWRALAAGLGLVMLAAAPGCNSPSKSATRYQSVKVERAAIVSKVSATGTLSALVTVQVGSQVSGRIQVLDVDYNSPVKKGQRLAAIDPALFQAALDMTKANVLAAEGNLARGVAQANDATQQYSRNRQLAEKSIVTASDLDTSHSNAEAAAAQVKSLEGALAQARAAQEQARLNLAYTRIVSPVDGIVVSRNVDLGQTVAAAFAAPTLFLIAEDLRRMQIDTSVAEADVGRLKEGMKATFTVDAYYGQIFGGVIRQVRNNPTTIQNVVTYDAVIDVSNPQLLFKPGMTANVTVVVARNEQALRVPNAALRFQPPPALVPGAAQGSNAAAGPARPDSSTTAPTLAPGFDAEGRRTVWVLADGALKPVGVRTGITDGTFTEIASDNLPEGTVVVTDILSLGNSTGGFRVF